MSYAALIDRNVTKAFNLVKDLAVLATFTKRSGVTFDFSDLSVDTTSTATVNAKVVQLKLNKFIKERNLIKEEILVKSSELGDLTQYTTVTIGSVVWDLGPAIKGDGFVFLLELYREA